MKLNKEDELRFYKEKNENNKVAKAWMELAKETANLDETPLPDIYLEEFGYIMASVVAHYGKASNWLWDSIEPQGTEDRLWFRSFIATKGDHYQNIFSWPEESLVKKMITEMEVAFIRSL